MVWIGAVYKRIAESELGAGHTSGIVPVKETQEFFGTPIKRESHLIKTIVIEFWCGDKSKIIKTHVNYFVSETHKHIHLTGNILPTYKQFGAKAGDVLLFWRSEEDSNLYRADLIKQGTKTWDNLKGNFAGAGGKLTLQIPESREFIEYQEESPVDETLSDDDFPPTKRKEIKKISTKRSPPKSKAKGDYVLKKFNYKCEMNKNHKTFLTPNGRPFMEKHHLIPLEFYEQFEYSVDDVSNIICLCPICHSQIHYGKEEDVKKILEKLLKKRINQLKKAHLEIDFESLKKMYL